MTDEACATTEELEAGIAQIHGSPKDTGTVRLIVRRPDVDRREVVSEGDLTIEDGLVGDNWKHRRRPGSVAPPSPDVQLTIMNARVAALVAGSVERWPLAGDQIFVDLDLGEANLPPRTRLALGSAVIEISEQPHTGCGKFVSRFGVAAMKFVNSSRGRQWRLRGLNARVVTPGHVCVGDTVRRA